MSNNREKKLPIHSILRTIQGEGVNTGKPALLIRLAGCNFTCPFCDVSDSSWKLNKSIIKYMTIDELIKFLWEKEELIRNIHMLMITGGEPTLYMKDNKQYRWDKLIDFWMSYDTESMRSTVIDIETNGSFEYYERLPAVLGLDNPREILQINISPKLFEDSFKHLKYINSFDDILKYYNDRIGKYNRRMWNFRYIFKFVLNPFNSENKKRIEKIVEYLDIPKKFVYILPLTPIEYENQPKKFTRELFKIQKETINYCIDNGFTFIPRIHIYLYKIFDHKEYEHDKLL